MKSGARADILARIVADKADEVIAARIAHPLGDVEATARALAPARDFVGAIRSRVTSHRTAVIAEIKKASPSRGVLRDDFEPAAIAASYAHAGAACLSVLTDAKYFQGADAFLVAARGACPLPVLRKEFIVDEYQVAQSRALGADAILLIVGALDDAKLVAFEACAMDYGMAVLVEVHDARELERALRLRTPLIGINNRDLKTFNVSLSTTLDLLAKVPAERIVVTESGIGTPQDVTLMRSRGVAAFLVGEALMRVADPGAGLAALFGAELAIARG
ncbi:MAG: indole-3-glycerol phosphate synthase TrpC [Casimicrobiaceae bacterium]